MKRVVSGPMLPLRRCGSTQQHARDAASSKTPRRVQRCDNGGLRPKRASHRDHNICARAKRQAAPQPTQIAKGPEPRLKHAPSQPFAGVTRGAKIRSPGPKPAAARRNSRQPNRSTPPSRFMQASCHRNGLEQPETAKKSRCP